MILSKRLSHYDNRTTPQGQSNRLSIVIVWVCQSCDIVKPLQDKDLRTVVIYINNIYIPFIRFLSYLYSHFAGLTYFNKFRIKKSIYIRGDHDA